MINENTFIQQSDVQIKEDINEETTQEFVNTQQEETSTIQNTSPIQTTPTPIQTTTQLGVGGLTRRYDEYDPYSDSGEEEVVVYNEEEKFSLDDKEDEDNENLNDDEEEESEAQFEKINADDSETQQFSNNQVYYDQNGNPFYYDQNGNPYYIDQNGNAYYLDQNGNAFYYDQNGNPFYYDQNGNPYYIDQNGYPYYVDQNGQAFYYDQNGNPFYYDQNGNAVYYSQVEQQEQDINDDTQSNNKKKGKRKKKDKKQKKSTPLKKIIETTLVIIFILGASVFIAYMAIPDQVNKFFDYYLDKFFVNEVVASNEYTMEYVKLGKSLSSAELNALKTKYNLQYEEDVEDRLITDIKKVLEEKIFFAHDTVTIMGKTYSYVQDGDVIMFEGNNDSKISIKVYKRSFVLTFEDSSNEVCKVTFEASYLYLD
ncbi:MAG: hypothetical protein IJW82_03575 [Clostridia bacterium]|nr:hypothetical protein [Clostridia bacterium]